MSLPSRSACTGSLEFDEPTTSRFDTNDDPTEGGGGIALGLSYGFGETVELFVDLGGYALHLGPNDSSPATLAHLDVGGRFHFRSPAVKLRPFASFALSGRAFILEGDYFAEGEGEVIADRIRLTESGGALTFGVGARYFFGPSWALHAQTSASYGEFTSSTVEGIGGDLAPLPDGLPEPDQDAELHNDITTMRLQFGIAWYPSR